MENYIVINGKKVELTEEQLKKLGIEVKDDPFEKVKRNEVFYYVSSSGQVHGGTEGYGTGSSILFNAANYCRDRKIMEQRALHETLNRLLWRFSMQNGGDEIDWRNKEQDKFYIFWDYENNGFDIGIDDVCKGNEQYFVSEEVAIQAIDEIIKPFMEEHPEFVW